MKFFFWEKPKEADQISGECHPLRFDLIRKGLHVTHSFTERKSRANV